MKKFIPMRAMVPHLFNVKLRYLWNVVAGLVDQVAEIRAALVAAELIEATPVEEAPVETPEATKADEPKETAPEPTTEGTPDAPVVDSETPDVDEGPTETETVTPAPTTAPEFDIEGCRDRNALADYAQSLTPPLTLKRNQKLDDMKSILKNHIEQGV